MCIIFSTLSVYIERPRHKLTFIVVWLIIDKAIVQYDVMSPVYTCFFIFFWSKDLVIGYADKVNLLDTILYFLITIFVCFGLSHHPFYIVLALIAAPTYVTLRLFFYTALVGIWSGFYILICKTFYEYYALGQWKNYAYLCFVAFGVCIFVTSIGGLGSFAFTIKIMLSCNRLHGLRWTLRIQWTCRSSFAVCVFVIFSL